jgi:hypothetical protein
MGRLILALVLMASTCMAQLPLPPRPQPSYEQPVKKPNFYHRHEWPIAIGIMGGLIGTGLTVGLLTRQQNCPSLGGRYNGTPGPNGCPTHCDKDGCYVEPGTRH